METKEATIEETQEEKETREKVEQLSPEDAYNHLDNFFNSDGDVYVPISA